MLTEWIDIHTHKPGRGLSVMDPCLGETEVTKESMVYYSLGIHPLYINENTNLRLETIEQAAADKKIIAIGEAGLDRNASVSMAEQMFWFERQVEIAVQYRLPVVVHVVRAIPEIIFLHNQYQAAKHWIIHGFNARREVLQDLLRHGFFISVGRQIMNQKSNIYHLLPEIPDERLFMETDDSEYLIEEIYRAVAARKGIPMEKLQQRICLNFKHLFL